MEEMTQTVVGTRCANIPTGTHVGVEREVQVAPELLDGAATPVFKHMQVGVAPELCGTERGNK